MIRKQVILLIGFLLVFSGCLENLNNSPADKIAEDSFYGIGLSPLEIEDFVLINQHNENVSLSDYKGKVIVVAFTYTSCPDVCPIIEHNLKLIQDLLGDNYGKEVVFISITLDPARDTPDKLRTYWYEGFGFEWDHLTHPDGNVVKAVWEDHFNVVVDNDYVTANHDHIKTNTVSLLYPNNTTNIYDVEYEDNQTGWNLTTIPLENSNISYNYTTYECCGKYPTEFKNHTAPDDNSWYWELLVWNHTNSSWDSSEIGIDSINVTDTTHIAWSASNADKSLLGDPTKKDCDGHGWVMGSGDGAHCMCDEGYKWDGDNHLTCISKNTEEDSDSTNNEFNESEPYLVGHQSITLILDQNQKKRVAWTGMDWDENEFVSDIMVLIG